MIGNVRDLEHIKRVFAETQPDANALYEVNSGSYANLIALSALTAPELGERQINKGAAVIMVACGFPIAVSQILQYGAVNVFSDV